MYQIPYDRRVESGGANAFKIFIILAFILFIIAIATPVSGQQQNALTNANPERDCGGSTIAQPGETVAALAYRCNTTTTEILDLNPGLTDAYSIISGQSIVLDEDIYRTGAVASEGQAVSNTVVQPEVVTLPATGEVPAQVAAVPQAGGGAPVVQPNYVYVPVTGVAAAVQPQVVYVPVTGASVPVAQPQVIYVPVTGAYTRAPVAYTVRTGDTLYSIARAYGSTVELIMAANPGAILSPDWIQVGQVIWIP